MNPCDLYSRKTSIWSLNLDMWRPHKINTLILLGSSCIVYTIYFTGCGLWIGTKKKSVELL